MTVKVFQGVILEARFVRPVPAHPETNHGGFWLEGRRVRQQPLAAMVHKLEQHSALDTSDSEALLALPCSVRSLAPGRSVAREGDKAAAAILLISGFCLSHKLVGNGGRQILALHIEGDLLDAQCWKFPTVDHNVQAISHCRMALIPREALRQIVLDRPAVALAMWTHALSEASIQREWTTNLGRRDSRTRVAHLLCELALRLESAGLGDRLNFRLPMTQEQLADATGLTTVHVNRTLRKLDAEGIIVRAKRSVTIADWTKFALAADFHPRYLQMEQ